MLNILLLLPLLAAVRAATVPAVEPLLHFHSSTPSTAQPQGRNITINGVLTYVSLPKHKLFDPSTALLLLTDIFGLPSADNLLLADQWAAAGFQTYVPDYLNGDAIVPSDDLAAWFANHTEAQTTPPLLAVLHSLKSHGIKKIAVAGYCFGGLYATRLAQNNTITVATVSHPSLLALPDDFDLLKSQSRVPLEINNAELDEGFTPEVGKETDSLMGHGQYRPGYKRIQFDAVGHGFAVRANTSDPVQVAAKQEAFDVSLAWIKAHLK
ncbi:protein AIM2 [Favolaschia claudopus]|uniref:Protein AIM2 n=1 Tax=Favolaschia claudopus TaxID=2862362 RepID=A0AAW0CN07_9AGAR